MDGREPPLQQIIHSVTEIEVSTSMIISFDISGKFDIVYMINRPRERELMFQQVGDSYRNSSTH